MEFCKLVLVLAFIGLSCGAETKSPCQGCKDLVDGILKGLDQTKNKNFGGGDTAWEEKKNLKYKVSETRLVEVLESACDKDNFRCNEIAAEREDDIETWYKTMQDSKSLQEFLCVEKAEVCCPEGKFGENCEESCPANENGEICFGNGKCEGSGDKQGSGACVCDEGYAGDLCNECGPRHFKSFGNDTYTMCTPCANGCETCLSANDTDCLTCAAGFREQKAAVPQEKKEEKKEEEGEKKEGEEGEEAAAADATEEEEKPQTVSCIDVNECVEQTDLCPVGEYCANTEGSYSCERKHVEQTSSSSSHAQQQSQKTNEEEEDEGLDEEDIRRLVAAVVICVIGTAAASGSIFWNLMFFISIFTTIYWWSSDKLNQLPDTVHHGHSEL